MGVGPAIFTSGGQRTEHWVPGVFSRSVSESGGTGGVTAGNAVIMGNSMGGKPFELYSFSSLQELQEEMVGGDLFEAGALAFNPSPSFIPQQMYFMRVNDGTQSTLTLKSSTTDVLTLQSWDWGTHTNLLKITIQDGTVKGKRVTTQYKNTINDNDNVYSDVLSIQYTGSGTNATATIQSQTLTTTVTGETADSVTFSFEDFPTVSELVGRLNDTGKYVAAILDGNDDTLCLTLDSVVDTVIMTTTTLTANVQAIINNLLLNPYVGSVDVLGERLALDNIPVTYFTGGTSGAYTVTEWATALTALESKDIQIVTTHSTDGDVQTLIRNHCITMSSTINRKERSFILGGPIGETVATAIANAAAFNTEQGSYVSPSFWRNSPITGALTQYTAGMLACMLAGVEATLSINNPLTSKPLDIIKFDVDYLVGDLKKLIIGGVIACGITDEGDFSVIRAMTTDQGNKLQDCERSMVRAKNYMARDFRSRLSPKIGTPGTLLSGGSPKTTLDLASADWLGLGLILPTSGGDNYWGFEVKRTGDTTTITYSDILVAPTNFIFATARHYIEGSSTRSVSIGG